MIWDMSYLDFRGGWLEILVRHVKVSGHNAIDVRYDLAKSPTGKSQNGDILRKHLGVRSCAYIIFNRADHDEIGEDIYHPLNGYIGETGDFVGRMNDVRMSYNSPKYSVYHGLGRYLRRNNIALTDLVCRIIPTKSKQDALELEQSIQMECRKRHGRRFAWEDGASSGRGSAVHKALDMIECIEDASELDTLMNFIKTQKKAINVRSTRSD